MKVKFKKTNPLAVEPIYATPGAACFDLTAVDNGEQHPSDPMAFVYAIGLSFEIPPRHAMMIYSRSGHGFKDGVRLSNGTGVIDSDYRGPIMVSLRRDGSAGWRRPVAGDRIAQAMIVPVDRVEFEPVVELSETARGAGGFGSTGN
jgi:dUTP pyrophosphatase